MDSYQDLILVSVVNKQQLKLFIYFPQRLHKDQPKWMPPIYSDEWIYFNKKKNAAFSYCGVEMVLCYYKNQLAGRIMGIVNHRYNNGRADKCARFSHLDCINNPMVSSSLLRHIEKWAEIQGINYIVGPFGMHYHDPIGYMIEGFEHEPSISTYYNYEYLPELIEKSGYQKKYDLVAYKIIVKEEIPEIYVRIRNRLLDKGNIRLLELHSKKDLRAIVLPLLQLLNECYIDVDGYSQLDEQEMQALAKQYLYFLDPKYIKLAKVDNELAGFLIAMPNISPGIRAAKGRLFPYGIFKILRAMKRSKQLDLLLGGIKKKYQGIGIDVLMGYDMLITAKREKFDLIDSHLEMELNYKVRAEMEKLGGTVYKKYRLFQKQL